MSEIEDEESALKRLRTGLIRTGFSWTLLISLLLLSTMICYHLIYIYGSNYSNYPNLALATLTFVFSCCLYFSSRRSRFRHLFQPFSIFVLTMMWLLLAYDLLTFWQDRTSAESILLFGFLVFMLGFHSSPSLLAASLPWLMVGNLIILIAEDTPESSFETLVSLITYPLVFLFSQQTIGRFYSQATEKYRENIRLIHKLKVLSVTDELTGIGNRKAFNQYLESLSQLSKRQKTPLSLVILDIDYFKQFNDCFGHPAGDACLKQVATLLVQQCQRHSDSVSRIGGEEFALILPDTNQQQASQQVMRIQEALHQAFIPHPDSPADERLTISFGIAQYQSEDIEQFYKRADQALYQAKQNGRNQYSIAS